MDLWMLTSLYFKICMSLLAKIQDGRQWLFEQNRFLTNNPIINCHMSSIPNEVQNMISIAVIAIFLY